MLLDWLQQPILARVTTAVAVAVTAIATIMVVVDAAVVAAETEMEVVVTAEVVVETVITTVTITLPDLVSSTTIPGTICRLKNGDVLFVNDNKRVGLDNLTK